MLKICASYALRERRYWQNFQKSCDQFSDICVNMSANTMRRWLKISSWGLFLIPNAITIFFFGNSKIQFFVEIKFDIHQWGANMFGYENAFVAFQYFTLVLGSFNRPKISINWNFWHFSRPIFTFHVKDVHRRVIQIDMNFWYGLKGWIQTLSRQKV